MNATDKMAKRGICQFISRRMENARVGRRQVADGDAEPGELGADALAEHVGGEPQAADHGAVRGSPAAGVEVAARCRVADPVHHGGSDGGLREGGQGDGAGGRFLVARSAVSTRAGAGRRLNRAGPFPIRRFGGRGE